MGKRKIISSWLLAGVLLSPSLVHAQAETLPFADISKHWAKKAIVYSVQQGLFAAGGNVRQFYPNRLMTRAEFLALVDRLLFQTEHQLFGLTLLAENDDTSTADGFDEPYLPYKDVDRLTWMYNPILRTSFLMDRLYGPNALQTVFAGQELKPGQPITREEVARLLQIFTVSRDNNKAWDDALSWGWLQGDKKGNVTRGEAAEIAQKLHNFMESNEILPLLDLDGTRFPLVPHIENVFPLFAGYTDNPTAEEKTYLQSVEAIRNQEDDEQTFAQLQKLANSAFPNQIGVHYYLSWNPDSKLEENMREAYAAIDAYFADKIILPDTLGLLAANVYDISLQEQEPQSHMVKDALKQLNRYESKLKKGTEEWQSLISYIAALEVKAGQMDSALQHFQSLIIKDSALIDTVYYLVNNGRLVDAERLVTEQMSLKKIEPKRKELLKLLKNDLTSLNQQDTVITDLTYSLRQMDNQSGYKIDGESTMSGYLFKYSQTLDQSTKQSHTTGFFQAPGSLVSEKMEIYGDELNHLQYHHDFDSDDWMKSSSSSFDYIHEWVESKSIAERAKELHARYFKQSFGPYDIITEWIPGQELRDKSAGVILQKGRLKQVPAYINKYYIDRDSDLVLQQAWRYEELYDSKEYMAYVGRERYSAFNQVKQTVPIDVKTKAGERR